MNAQPLVSVIIPNYNYGRSLAQCVRSVLEQDYANKEIIVVDDCSTDGSAEIARGLGVEVISTGRNSGVAVARNTGVEHASGEILFFLDSDVALTPGAIREAVDQLRDNPGIGAVCGMYEPEPLIRDSLVEECRCLQAYYWRTSSEGSVSFLISAICALRVEVFHEIGPFNPNLRQTEEVDYGQRLSQHYEIRLTPAITGFHDDDDRLWPLVRKIFTRGRLRVPLYARRRKFSKGFETAFRVWASVAAFLAVVTLPAPLVVGPLGWLLPAAALAAVFALDFGMYRYVASARGPLFLLSFAGVQLVFNLTVAVAVLVGAVHWVVSPAFRRLYDRDDLAASGVGAR
ncbi:glycosyltransferase family 2 protein [Marinitenerispora sediminis]|uniref:Glycosyl transferase n=1 Tax=Marinitenerispora sediminis TaxID=1931232 RepID=A0A368SZD5_9ACTN|nr:glycosyltransferase family 2 protein [Marinitenerispora sediminis]RCV47901.1 glycosyl transferase [Marinitenerispora sediminis]RCV48795.1 glycosyl transferase [Marinitenerispora sediminis]RCV50677.1 glycosyl transferase [Marinitenerispora sediminis]